MSAAEIVARSLGGARRQTNGGWLARCPVHDDHDPSLSLRNGRDGRLLVHCFVGCNSLDILCEMQRRGLLPPERRLGPRRPQVVHAEDGETIQHMRQQAAAILRRAEPIGGTLAERYLLKRGLDPEIPDPVALRFLPSTAMYPPSMVALISDFRDAAQVLGLQFTLLNDDGSKLDRVFMKGSRPTGGVIRLIEDAEVTDRLGLAEGVESALAVMTGFARSGYVVPPVWSALAAGSLTKLPVLPAIEVLNIFADNDASGVGQRAAAELALTWRAAGREVLISSPSEGGDWNDA